MGPRQGRPPPGGGPGAAKQEATREGDRSDSAIAGRVAQDIDERVATLLEALAPDAEAQAVVRRLRRRISGQLDLLADEEAGR